MADQTIDEKALDSLSVAPDANDVDAAKSERKDAGQDKSLGKRLQKNPDSSDARLDVGLDESMDASDPPSSTQPVHSNQPPKSSGFDAAAEAERQRDA